MMSLINTWLVVSFSEHDPGFKPIRKHSVTMKLYFQEITNSILRPIHDDVVNGTMSILCMKVTQTQNYPGTHLVCKSLEIKPWTNVSNIIITMQTKSTEFCSSRLLSKHTLLLFKYISQETIGQLTKCTKYLINSTFRNCGHIFWS